MLKYSLINYSAWQVLLSTTLISLQPCPAWCKKNFSSKNTHEKSHLHTLAYSGSFDLPDEARDMGKLVHQWMPDHIPGCSAHCELLRAVMRWATLGFKGLTVLQPSCPWHVQIQAIQYVSAGAILLLPFCMNRTKKCKKSWEKQKFMNVGGGEGGDLVPCCQSCLLILIIPLQREGVSVLRRHQTMSCSDHIYELHVTCGVNISFWHSKAKCFLS